MQVASQRPTASTSTSVRPTLSTGARLLPTAAIVDRVADDDPEPSAEGLHTGLLKGLLAARLFDSDTHARIGRYTVVQRLGSGGMGVVYAAHDAELDRKIAVKVLHRAPWSGDTAAHDRIRREAQAMARLNHPNVATVHEVGEHEGTPYVAMEFIEGITLREWVQAEPRAWRDVVEVYLQAARGLAAAHAVGLVHRDFKPDNAMNGADPDDARALGRVRVTDFGLARGSNAAALAKDSEAAEDAGAITRSSAVAGTPAYMAAEQFAGDPGDAKVDQFAFCVSLWEALVGTRPFAGENLLALAESVSLGKLDPAWPDRVPRCVQGVLARGLAVDPAARWPEMRALVAALQNDPSRRRTRRLAIGGFVLVAAGVVGVVRLRHDQRLAACDLAAAAIDETWNAELAEELRQGLVGTGAPDAAAAFDRARPWVDDFVGSWRTLRREQCVLATVEQSRDPALADASIACLEQKRSSLVGLVGVWSEPDVLLVQRLVHGASGLPRPEGCADDGQVLRRKPPPADPEIAAEVIALRGRIDRARALEAGGRTKLALEEATAIREAARTLAWQPLVAEALAEEGRIADRTGASAEAVATLREAFALAHANGSDEVAAAVATSLTYALASLGKPDDALQWSDLARAAAERIGETEGPMGASLEITTGFAYQQRGDFDQALSCYQRALELREALFGPRHPGVALAYQHIGLTQYSRERREEARAAFQRVLDIDVELFGEEHATVAHARDALGVLLTEQGEYDEALAMLEQARAVRARVFGEQSVWVAQSLHNLGNVWLGRGRPRVALDHYERSTALLGKLRGPDHPDRVLGLCNVGLSYSRLDEPQAAIASFREALRVQEAAYGADHPETARVLVYLGGELLRADAAAEAMPILERAEAIALAAFGPDHRRTIDAVQVRGEAFVRLGRPADAIPMLERALVANDDDNDAADPNDGGYTRFSLARALWDSGTDRHRAVTLAKRAAEIFGDDEEDPKTRDEIAEWLRTHRE
jgi:tetratricopeptide (TPR) repeat protein/tRNA A-37 threonylcarbamoyl transferase component Bud32